MINFYFGHHKCGSQFFRSLIAGIVGQDKHFPYNITKPQSPIELVYIDELDTNNLEARICKAKEMDSSVVSIINTTPKTVELIEDLCPDYRAFHVIRDPRELLISCYFDHRNSHPTSFKDYWHWPELELTKLKLNELNEEDGIIFEMDHIFDKIMQVQYNALTHKLNPQKVLTIKLEDFIQSPYASFQNILNFIGLNSTNLDLDKVINSGKRHKTQSKRGGWEDIATDKVKDLFYSRYDQIITTLGYEI